jgi:two-component system, response regulator PdtaR
LLQIRIMAMNAPRISAVRRIHFKKQRHGQDGALVVEDFRLRMDAVDIVRSAGFDAVEASNADDAIAILEASPNIHVVFTDIQMPGSMDGLKLAKFVKDRWPPIKIVATSGRVRISGDDLPEGGRFLPKPYSPAEVVKTLRDLLAD